MLRELVIPLLPIILFAQPSNSSSPIGLAPAFQKSGFTRVSEESFFLPAGPVSLLSAFIPNYPPLLLRKGESGTVNVDVYINERGETVRAEAMQSEDDTLSLRASSESCALRWRLKAISKSVVTLVFKYEFIPKDNLVLSPGAEYIPPRTLIIRARPQN